ncbi:Retrovirus-related Pol polyprotein from transposon TNT 1-94 [Vitis vinifera]|uniref:Retrovirus-related Pol polyprotein from transposon TNT 1-94 n=1 Tax=Vitis vinifera TaxID=29760 RepID=A0A438FE07_VITVI|nr:Retrovirus-related Pol polyprotein from transposon TNT 1-94 [Vitis vinifera]
MAEEAGKASRIEKFDGTDFAYWRMQIEDYLYRRKLHMPLLGTKPKSMKAEEWALLDRQVLGVIRLTLLEIDFDDEIRALIVLASLPNSWEAMRMAIRRRDAGETSGSGSTLNPETKGRGNTEIQIRVDQIPEILIGNISKSRLGQQVQCWNCGKTVDSPLDDWVLDSGASFHTTPYREIIQNYVAGDLVRCIWLMVQPWMLWVWEMSGYLCPMGLFGYWRRLGHMSEKGMKMLLSKGKLPELKSIDFDMCESYILGKQKKKWKAMVETEIGLKVKCLRSDNGGEYIDGGFMSIVLHRELGWRRPFLGHHSRMHCSLPDKPRTSVPMEFRLPEEVWSGKEVKFSHLKVFGCISYVHIDSDARSKLDAKSKICFFIGYGDEKFGYRSSVVSDVTEIDQKKFEFVNLDELTESTVQKGGEEDKENVNSQVDLSTPVVEVRRSSRNIRPPQCYSPVLNYLLLTDGGEAECYDEALQDENSSKWELAMKDEMDSLLGNQTWELTELPVGKKALHNRWVYRIKNEHDGSKRYKARLVVKGFQQKEGIDYTEIFSLVVKMSTMRLVLGMVAEENLHLEQLDVKTAFLHGDLEEDLYMIQPEGFIVQGQENLVCKLRKLVWP